jgi:hypothetical protein
MEEDDFCVFADCSKFGIQIAVLTWLNLSNQHVRCYSEHSPAPGVGNMKFSKKIQDEIFVFWELVIRT